MPLFKTIHHNPSTKILVWEITESFEELYNSVVLNSQNQIRLLGMKSQMHQRAFLSVRKLLQEACYSDLDLYYDSSGKPNLYDQKYISITHSHQFAAIIISDQPVGIDIELQREKIIRIADKFIIDKKLDDLKRLHSKDFIEILTVNWGAKEAIFKIQNQKGISFKNHINLDSFQLTATHTWAQLDFNKQTKDFLVYFESFEGFTLVFAFEDL
jgi:4'-phosphopantetheinyl transferase